jgi:hypothetical protein
VRETKEEGGARHARLRVQNKCATLKRHPHTVAPPTDAEQDTTAMLRRYVHSALSSKSKGSSNEAYARCALLRVFVCACEAGATSAMDPAAFPLIKLLRP